MRSAGIVLILSAVFLLYVVIRGRQSLSEPSVSVSSSSGPGGALEAARQVAADIGQHQAIDLTGEATGAVGSIYSIDATYANMTDQQKDNANAFARQIGNVAG